MKMNFQPSTSTKIINNTVAALRLAIVIICCASVGNSQGSTSHEIGYRQTGAYSISDIETVNMSNGNLMLNLQLASLPPGRGNVSAGITLSYNSKYLAVYRDLYPYTSPSGETTNYPIERLTQNFGGLGEGGGWKYNIKYILKIENRDSTYAFGTAPVCPDPYAPYDTKVKMLFADGSEHVFRPLGFYEYYLRSDGYFNVGPTGKCRSCQGNTLIYTNCAPGNKMVYYSIDGSYIRLEVEASQLEIDPAWTMYFPDGRRVTHRELVNGVMIDQRIYDRNDNYVEFQDITYNGHPATRIVDQLDRAVIIEYDTASHQDYIYRTGYGGTTLTTTVKWKNNYVHKLYNPSTDGIEIPELGVIDYTASQYVVDQVILPAQTGGLSYIFGYNGSDTDPSSNYTYGWGEMNSVILPTGAQAVYHYARDGQSGIFTQDVMQNTITQKDLIHQMEYDGASSSTTDTWTYSFSSFGNYASVTGPDGSVNADWFYKGNQFSWPPPNPDSWDNHLSIKSEGPEKKIERIWQPNTPSGISSPSGPVVMINPYLKTDFTSVKDASGNYTKTFIKDYKVDKNGNLTTVAEYDWVNYGDVPRDASGKPTGIPGTAQVKRVTVNEYFNPTPDSSDSSTNDPDTYHLSTSPNYRQALKSKEARAGFDASTVLSRNEYFYDDPTKMANLTEQRRWDSTKGGISRPLTAGNSISVTHQYDSYGNPTWTTDANGVQTQFIYDPINGHSSLYVTQAKVAAGTAVQRWAKQTYDFHTGLATQTIDVDNNITTNTTYDVFGRPTLVREASGTTVERRTVTEYSEINRRVITRADLNTTGDAKLVTIQHFDQLGRIRLSRNLEDAAVQDATDETHGIKVQTRYAFSGPNSFKVVSAPYRADNSSGAGNEGIMGWTRSKLDMAGRVIEVETFGGAILPFPWGDNSASTGKVVTQYDAELMTVTDQAGKKRRSETDALGRMVKVTEDPGGLSYDTFYLYDVLDNLRKVTQGAQTRWFAYDSLSLLIRVKNPEQNTNGSLPAYTDPVTDNNQWSMAYKYDPNSNLIEKTDARNIKTTYGYDGLNRNTTVSYSDSTPGITRTYDTATLGKGRLQKTETAGGMGSRVTINAYDAMGRPLSQSQQFFYLGAWGTSYTTSPTYDLAGNVKTMTYPSGLITANYSYDQAGRLSGSTLSIVGVGTYTGSDSIEYNAAGQMIKERFGTRTPLYHNLHYNNRLQLVDTRLGDSATDEWNWSRGAISFLYGTNAVANWDMFASDADNNGNLRRQLNYVPLAGGGYVIPQQHDYYYDALNRITAVREQQRDANGQWADSASQAYSYDRWGNRTLDLSGGGGGEVVWVDDALPAGASAASDGGDSWTWVNSNPSPYSGTVSHQSNIAAGEHQHFFYGATQTLQVNAGDRLYTYVYLDPANSPSEVMLQWNDGSGWEHRAYWGANNIGWGANGTASRRYMGPLPATGGWVRLEVPASAVGLEGKTVNGMAFSLYDGRATWDKAGKVGLMYGAGPPINNRVYAVDAGRNRLTAVNGVEMIYDAAGNQTDDGSGQRTYDGENRMLTATNGGVGSSYTYDADGRRVRRIVGGLETWHVYGIGGELLVEYAAGAAPSAPQKVYGYRNGQLLVVSDASETGDRRMQWLVQDHLGSTRMVVDGSGSLGGVRRHDFAPFGEELGAGVGIRSAALGYGDDSVRQKFAGYERDIESGLDFAEARYYANVQGRFTSVDPYNAVLERQYAQDKKEGEKQFLAYLNIPQQWNRYAYAINNPLAYIDPTGEAIELVGSEEERKKQLEALKQVVGKEAGTYLYENKVTDKSGTRYFVGILGNGPSGKGPAFENINSAAGEVAAIIRDPPIQRIGIVSEGTTLTNDSGHSTTIGPIDKGLSPGVTSMYGGHWTSYILDPATKPGYLPGVYMSDGMPSQPTTGELLGHELGHGRARATGDPNSNAASLRIENKVRTEVNHKKSTRIIH